MNPVFRASAIHHLVSIPRGYGITDIQKKKIAELEQKIVRTERQEEELSRLALKRDTPPPLSEPGKKYVREVWLQDNKKFRRFIDGKELRKGNEGEEDGITLVSDVDKKMYVKNADRVTVGHLSGESDIIYLKDDIVHDIKCCWDSLSFMNQTLESKYEWQLRAYMYLYGVKNAALRYCLVDCPESVYNDEYSRFCFRNQIIDDSLPEYEKILKQFRRNLIYTDTGLYTKEERVKTFTITYDQSKVNFMLQRIDEAVKYYNTITLNMIE